MSDKYGTIANVVYYFEWSRIVVWEVISHMHMHKHMVSLPLFLLTHLPWTKAAILEDDIFSSVFLNEISLKFVPRSPIDNKAALVQVMAWRRTGDKPLS